MPCLGKNGVGRAVLAAVVAAGFLVAGPTEARADSALTAVHLEVTGAVEYAADWVDTSGSLSIRPATGKVSSLRLRRDDVLSVSVTRFPIFDIWFGVARIADTTAGVSAFLPFLTDDVVRVSDGSTRVTARGWILRNLRFERFGFELTVTPGAEGGDPVLVGAGDISLCPLTTQFLTANLLDDVPGTVFTLGDNAYPDGSSSDFQCYDLSWGRHRERTRPAVGNHEYHQSGAGPYFAYFGSAAGESGKGWYSYDLGSWHVVVLNSNCSKLVGGCAPDSEQIEWLTADLAANPASCTVAYFHHPRFSSSSAHGSDPAMEAFWDVLYAAEVEVVMSGHDHTYERFGPQTPDGNADPEAGIRQFVVGTGGNALYSFGPPEPNSEVRNASTWGVLALTLHEGSYDWRFMPVQGQSFTDAGSDTCH